MKLNEIVLGRGRISDQIRVAVKRAIRAGEYKPGDKLPREDQLAATLKVSKVSVREALRDLEGEGIIEKRRGLFGGNFVAQPSLDKIKDLLANYYQFGTATPDELMEFANMLEPALLSQAARRRTDRDLEKMRRNIAEREEAPSSQSLQLVKIPEFHRIIADSCQNRLFAVVFHALMDVSQKALPPGAITAEDVAMHLRSSKELYRCLLRRDESSSIRIMASISERYTDIRERAKGA